MQILLKRFQIKTIFKVQQSKTGFQRNASQFVIIRLIVEIKVIRYQVARWATRIETNKSHLPRRG